jgi:Family of unknown function (DUF5947)
MRAVPTSGLERLKRVLAGSGGRNEACDFCNSALDERHAHLVDLHSRALLCVCRPCGLLFAPEGAGQGRYRSVPDRCLSLGDGPIPVWDLFEIPVGVAFFFFNSTLGRVVAMYPGPAGATESLIDLSGWTDVASAHPAVATMAPDVEALLLRRTPGHQQCYLVPIDVCYELVGLLRRHWKGFDGGEEAARAMDAFFSGIENRAAEHASAT